MKHKLWLVVTSLVVLVGWCTPTYAFTIANDPQYVVINVSDFYFADWDAPEASWSATVKPEIVAKLQEIEDALGPGTDQRQLAWSTLLEYTDFPMPQPGQDNPGPEASYVIQARRIMEVAEAVDIPVFMPLNGYQWWNEVPELWNHWDPDGTQTPGCTNDEYDQIERYEHDQPVYKCKFPKLRDPAFRKRFIEGYNPENKWNVEWQNWQTPMRLNWRNWGAGGFQLAPPPNLVDHERSPLNYHDFQQARYTAIITQIAEKLEEWEKENKQYLFAGLTIGTEVSLNASISPADEFVPYGYRGMQDYSCDGQISCGMESWVSAGPLAAARGGVINQYLTNLSKIAVKAGIPKQRVYTHVWSETRQEDARYFDYFYYSINSYARPTLSLYGDAQDPLALPLLKDNLEHFGQPVWGAAEFSTDKTAEAWAKALSNTMANPINSAKIIDVYNWQEHVNTPAVEQMKLFLAQTVENKKAVVSEIIPEGERIQVDPTELTWRILEEDQATTQEIMIYKGVSAEYGKSSDVELLTLSPDQTTWQVSGLEPGVYQWMVERSVSNPDGKWVVRYSEPRTIIISVKVAEPSWWQEWL
jgi:hypothetical protein